MWLDERYALNLSLCQECGGRCCQGSPGTWFDPERFFAIFFHGERLTLETLRERLPDFGLVLWEKSGVPVPAPLSLDAGCTFLGPDGCRLSVAERPCQCLALIPVKETLDRSQGCLCRFPDEFSRDVGQQAWQNYWQSI